VVPGSQHHGGLRQQVDGEGSERVPDQPQAVPLALPAGSGQLPDHDRGGADLDQGVEAEAGQRHRPGRDLGDGQHYDPGHVPGQRHVLQREAAAQQGFPCRVVHNCHEESLPAAQPAAQDRNLLFPNYPPPGRREIPCLEASRPAAARPGCA
jgi:hypothetical protein